MMANKADTQARMDILRTGLQDIVSAAHVAKTGNQLVVLSTLRARGVRLMLDYINNGYIDRLWDEIGAPG